MYTCRTCKFLQRSKAERDFYKDENGAFIEYKCVANSSIIDAISEWYCTYRCRWWNTRPLRGEGCMDWQNMNGKHWI